MSTRAEKLRQKIAELEAQYKQELAKDKGKERKLETRKKVLVGAMILQWVKDGSFSEEDLLAALDSFLLRDYDRAVFDLPPKQKPFPAATSTEQQPAKETKPPAVPPAASPRSSIAATLRQSAKGENSSATVIPHPATQSAPKEPSRAKPSDSETNSGTKKRLPERAQEALEDQFML